MGGFQEGAAFRVAGAVVRRFVNDKGTFAALTLDVNRSPRAIKVDLRTFNRGIIEDVRGLTAGQKVQITGQIDIEPLKTKSGEEVKIDGYKKWLPALTIKELKIEGSSRRAEPAPQSQREQAPAAAPGKHGDDDFGDDGSMGGRDSLDEKDVPF